MFKTTNGGLNWNQISIQPLVDFNNFSFVNYETGFVIGLQLNNVFKTTNYGLNWTSIADVKGADDSYCIFFSSINTGWCAGTLVKCSKQLMEVITGMKRIYLNLLQDTLNLYGFLMTQ